MKARITVDMSNEAFMMGRSRAELAEIFEKLAKTLEYGDSGLYEGIKLPLYDSNGNIVGYFDVKK